MGDSTRFWKRCRVGFRLFRITVLLFVLALVCAMIYLDRVGLPDFAKKPLIEALRQRGVELQFVRLRWNFVRGLIADNVHVGVMTPDAPSASFSQVRLELNYHALMHRKWQMDGLVLRQGTLTLPVTDTNGPPYTLTLDHIQTDLHFATNDVWSLENFQAGFAGARFTFSGQLTDARAVQNWKIFQRKPAATPGAGQAQFKKIARALSQIHFNRASQVMLSVSGDAANLNSFAIHLGVSAPSVQTPWGNANDIVVVVRSVGPAQPATTNLSQLPEIDWTAHLTQLTSPKVEADSIACSGYWNSPTNLGWNAQVSRLVSPKLNADFISCVGYWQAPVLAVTNLFARLGGGELHAAVGFNVDTRELSFTNASCFNLGAVLPLLTEKTRERLAQFSLPQAPDFRGSGSLVVPDWTKHAPDWTADVRPTIRLNGELSLTNASFSSFLFPKIHTSFSYSNEVWSLPNVLLTQPAGQLAVAGTENDSTKDYQWHIFGWFAPDSIKPFLTPKALRGFHNFAFAEPLYVDAHVSGRLYNYDSIEASGHVQLKHFSIRGEAIDNVATDFHYAHLKAEFFQPHLEAGPQTLHADGILLDYPGDRIYFTNGLGTADPQMVATAIGPLQARVMQPYHFLQLPTARVNGYAPLRDATNADMNFVIVGNAAVQILKLKTRAITGEIHWQGQTLVLTNITGTFYGGTGNGHVAFDFRPVHSANFSFATDLQNVDLHLLANDLDSPTNHFEGLVNGNFVVTSGNSADWRTCNGYGRVSLRNGLLWDAPVFGLLSPIMNSISPGLGNSRATDASGQLFMTNGVIATDNFIIHTSMVRIMYDGTVDLQGRLNARVTGLLLRDLPAVGGVFSTVFWPVSKAFECKVTGTWKHPVSKLVYFPTNVLLFMLHPIHSLEDLSMPPASVQPK
jgi:hypothetical protein